METPDLFENGYGHRRSEKNFKDPLIMELGPYDEAVLYSYAFHNLSGIIESLRGGTTEVKFCIEPIDDMQFERDCVTTQCYRVVFLPFETNHSSVAHETLTNGFVEIIGGSQAKVSSTN